MSKYFIQSTIFVLLLSVAGCTTAKTIIGPDGTENQLITCEGIENCYEKATEVCKGPYQIIHSSSETSGYSGITGTEVKLLVKCSL